MTISFGFARCVATGHTAQAAQAASATLKNRQDAFNGESNANARYVAFAKKADEEGYGKVASLFCGAARAEAIHAAEHAEVIKSLGGEPKAEIAAPEVKSTKENLEAARKGETHERDMMYPKFIKAAKAARVKNALRSLSRAKTAEGTHAEFYADTLDDLDQWKGGTKDFYVCSVCGYTKDSPPTADCLSCFAPKEKYIAIR